MQYKVTNVLCDMKLLRNGKLVIIKQGQTSEVSAEEYQYLSAVYGMSVKGEKTLDIRVTKPVEFNVSAEKTEEKTEKKKRKHKKS